MRRGPSVEQEKWSAAVAALDAVKDELLEKVEAAESGLGDDHDPRGRADDAR